LYCLNEINHWSVAMPSDCIHCNADCKSDCIHSHRHYCSDLQDVHSDKIET
jgi:hypothetical protein